MAHRRAKLTPFGRLLLAHRVEVDGWPVAQAAEAVGVSRATAYKWVRRFKEEGLVGLDDRSSAPAHRPHALPSWEVRRILRTRRRLRVGPHRLAPELGLARSTVYGVLRRHGVSRLRDSDRPTAVPVRYVKDRPGELLHIDVKKLGRIRPGGGHRGLGRTSATADKGLRVGYDYLHVAVDDHSRVAYVRVFPDENGETAARFLLQAADHFAGLGVRIERVMTDRHRSYMLGRPFPQALERVGARHRPTRGYRPQTNGKAERFIQTLLAEWAYAKLYRSNDERLKALPRWVKFYNSRRPHTALGGQPPISAMFNNVGGNYT